MKLKQFGLLTAASLALVACSNESDPVLGGEGNGPKTVTLRLDGFSSGVTKSTDVPTTGESGEHPVSVHDIAVIFYQSGGNITNMQSITVSDGGDWADITDADGKTFEGIDPGADRVMVLGNYEAMTGKASIKEGVSIADVKGMKISLASQNQSGKEYGTETTSTKSMMTLYGDAQLTQAGTGEQTYSAEVSIAPIVSRIEVTGVSCTFKEKEQGEGSSSGLIYSKVKIKAIGLFDYYSTMTLDGTTLEGEMTGSNINKPGETGGSYVFGEASPAEGTWKWAYDNTESGYNNGTDGLTGSKDETVEFKTSDDKAATFAYNFFPVTSSTNIEDANKQVLANIRLLVDATTGSDTQSNDYVVTTNFKKDGNVVKPAPGKIYKFLYNFATNNIRQNWEDDNVPVKVKVEVVDWEIIPVTPSF